VPALNRLRLHKTEAIVLKHLNIGEGDRIVTFYTPHLGKLRAVARGAREIKSHLAGHLEPLTRCRVLVHQGRTLHTISQCETIESNLALREDLWRLTRSLYLAELVERFAQEGQENEPLYLLFQDCLAELATAANADLLLRFFEMQLLGLTGFEPELAACVECRTVLTPTSHFFSASAGGVLCGDCRNRFSLHRPLSLNALKVLRFLAAANLSQTANLRLPESLAMELEVVTRQYLRYLLEQELKSTDFLDMLRRDAARAVTARELDY